MGVTWQNVAFGRLFWERAEWLKKLSDNLLYSSPLFRADHLCVCTLNALEGLKWGWESSSNLSGDHSSQLAPTCPRVLLKRSRYGQDFLLKKVTIPSVWREDASAGAEGETKKETGQTIRQTQGRLNASPPSAVRHVETTCPTSSCLPRLTTLILYAYLIACR